MVNKEVYTLFELYQKLQQAISLGLDQSIINNLAYELVCRLYVPFTDMSFDDMLLEYGYVDQRLKNRK